MMSNNLVRQSVCGHCRNCCVGHLALAYFAACLRGATNALYFRAVSREVRPANHRERPTQIAWTCAVCWIPGSTSVAADTETTPLLPLRQRSAGELGAREASTHVLALCKPFGRGLFNMWCWKSTESMCASFYFPSKSLEDTRSKNSAFKQPVAALHTLFCRRSATATLPTTRYIRRSWIFLPRPARKRQATNVYPPSRSTLLVHDVPLFLCQSGATVTLRCVGFHFVIILAVDFCTRLKL